MPTLKIEDVPAKLISKLKKAAKPHDFNVYLLDILERQQMNIDLNKGINKKK